jgi:hypothetical protein
MQPILYAFLGLFGGAFLIGAIVAILLFLKYVREMKESVDKLRTVLSVLSKDNTLTESLGAFRDLVKTGNSMLVKMETLNTTIDLFYKVALKTDQMIAGQVAAGGGSGESEVYAYDEEAAARSEVQRKLRQHGVQMPPDKEIPADKAVGAQV